MQGPTEENLGFVKELDNILKEAQTSPSSVFRCRCFLKFKAIICTFLVGMVVS